jgi:hypothetical protein
MGWAGKARTAQMINTRDDEKGRRKRKEGDRKRRDTSAYSQLNTTKYNNYLQQPAVFSN